MNIAQEIKAAAHEYQAHFAERPTHCVLNYEAWADLNCTVQIDAPGPGQVLTYMGMKIEHDPQQEARVHACNWAKQGVRCRKRTARRK